MKILRPNPHKWYGEFYPAVDGLDFLIFRQPPQPRELVALAQSILEAWGQLRVASPKDRGHRAASEAILCAISRGSWPASHTWVACVACALGRRISRAGVGGYA